MEKEKKTVTVEIPEGKKAVWNEQGILQLVDDDKKANEPKPVTERIKTFYDAYSELAHYYPAQQKLIEEYDSVKRMGMSDDIVAYMQLRIITAALNEGWKHQIGWLVCFPDFFLYTKTGIGEMSDYEKDKKNLLLLVSSGDDGVLGGFGASTISCVLASRCAPCGYHLVYGTAALAKYAGRQFASIYARFFLGDKAKGLKPWREVEGKEEPADEEEES